MISLYLTFAIYNKAVSVSSFTYSFVDIAREIGIWKLCDYCTCWTQVKKTIIGFWSLQLAVLFHANRAWKYIFIYSQLLFQITSN